MGDTPDFENLVEYANHPVEVEEDHPNFSNIARDLHVSNPVGFLDQFVKYYGPSIFILWKAVIMKARILFYAPPPVEAQCYRGSLFPIFLSFLSSFFSFFFLSFFSFYFFCTSLFMCFMK